VLEVLARQIVHQPSCSCLGVEAAQALCSVAPWYHLHGSARTCVSVPKTTQLAVSEFSEPKYHLCLSVSASGCFHDAFKITEST
jgi:hypothetical protein